MIIFIIFYYFFVYYSDNKLSKEVWKVEMRFDSLYGLFRRVYQTNTRLSHLSHEFTFWHSLSETLKFHVTPRTTLPYLQREMSKASSSMSKHIAKTKKQFKKLLISEACSWHSWSTYCTSENGGWAGPTAKVRLQIKPPLNLNNSYWARKQTEV